MPARIALLSNVNVDPVKLRLEKAGITVWSPNGYGDVVGALADPASGLLDNEIEAVFIVVDTCALLSDCYDEADCEAEVARWYSLVGGLIPSEMKVYVSDASCRQDPFSADRKLGARERVEIEWDCRLRDLVGSTQNVYAFPLSRLASEMGLREFYSEKMWYLARMPHSSRGQAAIAYEIARLICPSQERKALVLDLDNTLWGGVVGELGPEGIELSDEHMGLVYKDIQRECKRMQRAGVVLAVASKNNAEDALAAFRENGHMILGEADVSSMKLNWGRKDRNIEAIASDLNLGVDSFAFLDDNPAECDLVERMLPEVEVIGFPDDVSELPALLRREYVRLFQRDAITEDDRRKTEQYAANARRTELEASSLSFEDYLNDLGMRAERIDPGAYQERIAQLIGKTNQFNLTTIRYTQAQVAEMIASDSYRVYAYDLLDRFGDNGITAVAIVGLGEVPEVDTLILSCRIMGRRVEDFVVDRIESELEDLGYGELFAEYRPTPKNRPVEGLYDRLGYERVEEGLDGRVRYRIDLGKRPKREIYVKGE